MKRKGSFLPVLFTVIMLVFVFFIAWYLPSSGQLRFRLEDIQKSLETSQGRERKQQHEYDEVVAAIPEIQEELDRMLPLSEAAKQEVKDLKAERKKLRQEKKDLESEYGSSQEADDHE